MGISSRLHLCVVKITSDDDYIMQLRLKHSLAFMSIFAEKTSTKTGETELDSVLLKTVMLLLVSILYIHS